MKNRPYTDDQLRWVFSLAPTTANCELLAAKLNRSVGAIRLLYQFAGYSDKVFVTKVKYATDRHVLRVRAISKEMGWIRSSGA